MRVLALCACPGLTEDMYDDGYTSIANIDISKIVVDQMTDRHRDKAGLTCTPCRYMCCRLLKHSLLASRPILSPRLSLDRSD